MLQLLLLCKVLELVRHSSERQGESERENVKISFLHLKKLLKYISTDTHNLPRYIGNVLMAKLHPQVIIFWGKIFRE